MIVRKFLSECRKSAYALHMCDGYGLLDYNLMHDYVMSGHVSLGSINAKCTVLRWSQTSVSGRLVTLDSPHFTTSPCRGK
jgi:hypothetical protein